MDWLFILAAVAAAAFLPHFLVEAVRAEDEDKRSNNKLFAGLCAAVVVFVLLAFIN